MSTPAGRPRPQTRDEKLAILGAWKARYEHDIIAWVREELHVEPHPWQLEVLEQYNRRCRRIAVRSGHGVGKTTVLAWMILHHILFLFPQKTQVTATTEKQLYNALWAEVKKWYGKLPEQWQRDLIEIKHDSAVFCAAPGDSFTTCATSRAETPEALAGIHRDDGYVLLIGDEASGIPEQVFEAASGSMSGPQAMTILAGNPIRGQGFFFNAHGKLAGDGNKGTWYTKKVACQDVPGQVAQDYIDDMALRYGENSNQFRVRVLGEFPTSDDDTVIPFDRVEPACGRDVSTADSMAILWGLDCARFGRDRSALAKRQQNRLLEPIRAWYKLDTMELAARVKLEWDGTVPSKRPRMICVDANGIGAGVADRLRQLGLPVRAVNVSESTSVMNADQYQRMRDELWFKMAAWFAALDVTIPEAYRDTRNNTAGDLIGELTAPKYKFLPNGKIKVESKDEMKKRGVESPDLAEALMMTFAEDSIKLSYGSEGTSNWNTPVKGPDVSIV